MAPGASSVAKSEADSKLYKYEDSSTSIPKHSYWFDFWLFVVFDIALFFFVYFIVP